MTFILAMTFILTMTFIAQIRKPDTRHYGISGFVEIRFYALFFGGEKN